MKIIRPLTFNPFTFSRASEAYFLNGSGIYDVAAADVLRFGYEYDPVLDQLNSIGAIIEDEAENLVPYSNEFELWTEAGFPGPTITDNFITSPDGTTNAARFLPGGSGTQVIYIGTGESLAGRAAVFSVFLHNATSDTAVRLNVGDATSVFRINPGDYDALEDNARITPYPDGWFLCEIYVTSGTSMDPTIQPLSGKTIYMYQAQVEITTASNDYRATSRIPTSGTPQTRAADIVVSQTPSLVSSNIEEDDAPVWDSGDSYLIGESVMVLGEYHRAYEALNDSTNSFPPDNLDGDDPDWLDTGATNRWRMFDMLVGAEKQSLSTVSSGDIDVLMSVESYVTSVVLLNASGVTATVIMRNSLNEIIYERSIDLLGTAMGIGWWEFFFGYRNGIKTIVLTDLPKIAPATIQVIIDGGGGVSGLGKLIIGDAIEIGCTKFGTTVGIIDFSRKERDAFGNNYILQRRYIDKVDYDIQIDSDKVDDVKDILTSVRSTPAVYIGSENKFKSTVVFGFYRDFSIVIEGSRKSKCAISVEGI